MKASSSKQRVESLGLREFKANIAAALRRADGEKEDAAPDWLKEAALAGMAEAGLEKLPADLGFPLGSAAARFRRIAKEVAEADGHADPEQSAEAAAALRTMAEILKSLPVT
jgi:hypothetical protein